MKATESTESTDGVDDDRMTRNYVDDGRMTRAKFLAASGGALAAGLLAACGLSSSSEFELVDDGIPQRRCV